MTDAKPLGIPLLATTTFDSWERTIRGHCMQHGLINFFKPSVAPVDPAALSIYETNRTKAASIFIQYMGDKVAIRWVGFRYHLPEIQIRHIRLQCRVLPDLLPTGKKLGWH
ncbi:hypothetical protein PCASD_13936 [Puccinia coronata f. sp. avenae]|uniref:Uncharacterized protein n=1 Tax=Puccinia coronata f. sp. avenae TaxID=200324 RepID=A0A2N5UHF4_9BASI|nr:hypothetical protein PCASD_13936 [Puccinia coronata f. sp. avenae]